MLECPHESLTYINMWSNFTQVSKHKDERHEDSDQYAGGNEKNVTSGGTKKNGEGGE